MSNPTLKPGAASALDDAAGVQVIVIGSESAAESLETRKPGLFDKVFGSKKGSSAKEKPAGKVTRSREGLSPANPPAGVPLAQTGDAAPKVVPPVVSPPVVDPELAGLVQVPFMLLASRYGDEMLLTEKEANDLGKALGPVLVKYGFGALDQYALELTLLTVGLTIAMPRFAIIKAKTASKPKTDGPQAAISTAGRQPNTSGDFSFGVESQPVS